MVVRASWLWNSDAVQPEDPRGAAVVVDRWPLMRLGLRRVLDSLGIAVAAEADRPEDGLALARTAGARMLVLGDATHEPIAGLVALAADPGLRVVALVAHVTRDRLQAMLAGGVAGVCLRSTDMEAIVDLILRVQRGERAVGPSLVPVLVGLPGEAPPPPVPFDAAVAGASGLTLREREVLRALASGASNGQIATQLYLSTATVKTHLANIYAKLQVSSRHQALSRAVALGLLS